MPDEPEPAEKEAIVTCPKCGSAAVRKRSNGLYNCLSCNVMFGKAKEP